MRWEVRSWETQPSWGQVVCSSETHRVALIGPRRTSSDNVTGKWFGLFSGFLQTTCPALPAWLFGRNLGVFVSRARKGLDY